MVIGRRRELGEIDDVLERADNGAGRLLVLVGPAGSGRTALTEVAAQRATRRGFEVLRVPVGAGLAQWWRWSREAGAPMTGEMGPLDLDAVATELISGPRRLVLLDDADQGGTQGVELLRRLAVRLAVRSAAVIATSTTPVGLGRQVRLGALNPDELGELTGEDRPSVRYALWAASRGRPGPARSLARTLAGLPSGADPVLHLALRAESAERFLGIDTGFIRLLETALGRASDAPVRARLLARLAYALLGDASEAGRRRALVDEALVLARESGDPAVLAEVLDARLHALWDSAGAQDRLASAAEIVALARDSADLARERRGLFWRFVALMELGRVAEAESALAAFEREARSAGDAAGEVMAMARHAMLATLRGRFADAARMIEQVADRGRAAGLADTGALVGTMRGAIAGLRGDATIGEEHIQILRTAAQQTPGHFYEATAARLLLAAGRRQEAALELERALPLVLSGSGPRWLGAAADLAAVAEATQNAAAAAALRAALAGYRGRLVVWAGANTVTGPVAHYLGLLAGGLGDLDEAADLLTEAITMEQEIGALPWLARSLAARAGVLARRDRGDDALHSAEHRGQARDIAERLDMPELLAAPSGPARAASGPAAPAQVVPADGWTLRRDGADWVLEAGAERARLRDGRGLHYLRALLAVPGQEIAALDLAAGGAGLRESRADPLLDREAMNSYRKRLAELDTELDAADRSGDRAGAARAESERQVLLDSVRRATGLGGRRRRVSAPEERARVNVTRTLRAALDHISAAAPKAGAHLAASIRTGRACRYQPAPGGPARWHL